MAAIVIVALILLETRIKSIEEVEKELMRTERFGLAILGYKLQA